MRRGNCSKGWTFGKACAVFVPVQLPSALHRDCDEKNKHWLPGQITYARLAAS